MLSRIILFFTVACVFNACGKAEQKNDDTKDAVSISLKLPENQDPGIFWLRVSKKSLVWESGTETKKIPWSSRSTISLDVSQNAILKFEGLDDQEHILVFGEAQTRGGKKIVIPVRKLFDF